MGRDGRFVVDSSEEDLARALQFGDEGDWLSMAEYLRGILEGWPDDATVLCWLGVAERELGMDGVAYERFRACLAAEPTDPKILAMVGNGLARFDDPEAESILRTATLMDPSLAYARTVYGAYLAREGMSEEALVEIEAAVALVPEDPETLTEWGVALALAGRLDEAVDAFYQACDADPEDGWARALVGLALVILGRTADALADLLHAADLRPEDVEVALVASLAAAACDEVDRAYEMVERARLRGIAGDLPMVDAVLDRVEEGSEPSMAFLIEEVVSGVFRERLMTRP
jgi:tetratricopeptide (TPR) repeat protein